MYLHREIYKSDAALDALRAVIKAKGRNVSGLTRKVQDACNSLSPEAGRELFSLCARITLSYNYRKTRLKAVHNQRNISEEARTARVWSFLEQNPDHPLAKEKQFRPKLNYWEKQ